MTRTGVKATYNAPEHEPTVLEPSQATDQEVATDRDAPTAPSDSALGQIRADVIRVQSVINKFLTARMQNDVQDEKFESRLLDGDDEIEEDE
ncbi:hypothetical protein B0I72DRAFT_7997 [Yarrowia lipolytica]|jgi:hypothetical protein|uniref:EKC/KEOPS complex subunit GON7 n=1 Tax=Yarrowia lipolytica TaxID=4952 RepID=A0A371C1Y0_YARLL|nr:hypothetical protein BKA91DRAFT_140268 [Yarrowia lipolytica]KAE8173031.1 hypothetical protein BKA90DRAFT_136429 [Yarrowia lipolytica]QNP96108.1 hypothetical protein YALI2_B00414g [Yarrowia lipolytica]RDW24321.1 hypothetical protein B0I71DRAFT_134495 [Yarrowia lipolytica]RDW30637.1 hypothetical protein B0I72DRAFT_7997 [Yarrowia lipolytica]